MSMPKRWSYDHSDVTNEFSFHPADEVTGAVHDAIREATAAVAHRFVELLPEGDAKKQAVSKLREAMMWANAAVATQHDPIWRAEVAQLAITDETGDVRYPRLVLESPPQDQAQVAELVFQALGAASMAWIRRGAEGVPDARGPLIMGNLEFDSDLARTIGNDLMVALGYRVPDEAMAARLPQDLAAMAAVAALIDVGGEPSPVLLSALSDADAANVEAAPETQAALKRHHPGPGGSL